MKKTRAFLCVVISLALLLSCTVASSAKGGETANVGISVEKPNYLPGDTFETTISISTNYNAIAMRWFVLYSKSTFELNGENGNFSVTESFGNIGGNVSYNVSDSVAYPAGYSSEDYGIVLIQWLGGGENLAVFNHPQPLECFRFSLKVKEDAQMDAIGEIFIPDNSSYYNAALEDANNASTYYKADGLVCSFSGASVVVSDSIEPQLLPVENTDTVIDDTKKIIYGFTGGIDSEDDILENVHAIGDNTSIEIEPTPNGYGTGTVVKLLQNGEVVDRYAVVFLGDATGDAYVDEADIIMIDLYIAYLSSYEETDPVFMGMDPSMDGYVDESDFILVDLNNAYLGEIDQVNGGIIYC